MKLRQLRTVGVVGAVVTAVCCFTPVLVWLAAALGASAWLAWSDAVLLPLLALFVLLAIGATVQLRRRGENE